MKDDLLALLKESIDDPKTGEKKTTQELMLAALVSINIERPNFKDLEFICDTIGEKPVDKNPQNNQPPIVLNRGDLLKEDKSDE